ncbi:MAG: glycoside hydrolase family 5 protein [Chloroflexi bacterium]|nr:glycoside hydrolase family 5 protein [Chloroflexota bacterium]MCC6893675.1 hypothetical protein [Anaerolineae bacterium]
MSHPPMELWAFLENSDFLRRKNGELYRQDEVQLIRHDQFLETDYQLMVDIGCIGIRDAARWYVTHTAPDTFDWTWLDRVVAAAEKYKLTLYIDLWHYGYPEWLDIMSPEAPAHFAAFATAIAERYPSITHWCICNEPTLLVERGGQLGEWQPFLTLKDPAEFRRQICRCIIAASQAVRNLRPDALLILPDPWHATDVFSEDHQAAVIDTVLGLRDADLGGSSDLIDIIGLNHYRDSTLPPLHKLFLNAKTRWPDKPLWFTETSGPPVGWQQTEWFWWMLAETRLANNEGADISAFTWAPAISMYDWVDETLHLANGIWILEADGKRVPNGKMPEAIALARSYGYIK